MEHLQETLGVREVQVSYGHQLETSDGVDLRMGQANFVHPLVTLGEADQKAEANYVPWWVSRGVVAEHPDPLVDCAFLEQLGEDPDEVDQCEA